MIRREANLKTKMRIFNVIILPFLVYIATTWPLTATEEEERLDAFEIKLL